MIRNADILSLNTTLFYRRNQLHVSAIVNSNRYQFIQFFYKPHEVLFLRLRVLCVMYITQHLLWQIRDF